jgi:hypothetical protein
MSSRRIDRPCLNGYSPVSSRKRSSMKVEVKDRSLLSCRNHSLTSQGRWSRRRLALQLGNHASRLHLPDYHLALIEPASVPCAWLPSQLKYLRLASPWRFTRIGSPLGMAEYGLIGLGQ